MKSFNKITGNLHKMRRRRQKLKTTKIAVAVIAVVVVVLAWPKGGDARIAP